MSHNRPPSPYLTALRRPLALWNDFSRGKGCGCLGTPLLLLVTFAFAWFYLFWVIFVSCVAILDGWLALVVRLMGRRSHPD